MLRADCFKHTLEFKRPGGTSRGVLKTKDSWFIRLWEDTDPNVVGIGECSLIHGLSPDAVPHFGLILNEICNSISSLRTDQRDFGLNLLSWPSISFGLDLALRDLRVGGSKHFHTPFIDGCAIPINGLIWMGEKSFMREQIEAKLKEGLTCIKLKIGAIDFEDEIDLLKYIRSQYSAGEVELRVDANGAFLPGEALDKLKRLSELNLHSIEQPIVPGQYEEMAALCEDSPLDIALDEELIGPFDATMKEVILKEISPQYLILKPSLHGGFHGSEEWIRIAEEQQIKWWATSALESNIGLNAIAQWVMPFENPMPQGLGTGGLFRNNIESPLFVSNGRLSHYTGKSWDLSLFNSI